MKTEQGATATVQIIGVNKQELILRPSSLIAHRTWAGCIACTVTGLHAGASRPLPSHTAVASTDQLERCGAPMEAVSPEVSRATTSGARTGTGSACLARTTPHSLNAPYASSATGSPTLSPGDTMY